jgi:YidC/Oxa1 family membrane protein insertase
MEERERFTFALMLCVFITFFYLTFLLPQPQSKTSPPKENPLKKNEKGSTEGKGASEDTENITVPPIALKETLEWIPQTVQTLFLQNKTLKIELSSQGASIQKVWLKEYFYSGVDKKEKDWEKQEKNWFKLVDSFEGEGSFALKIENIPWDLQRLNWQVDTQKTNSSQVVFYQNLPTGLKIYKTFALKSTGGKTTVPEEDYQIQLNLFFENTGSSSQELRYVLNTASQLKSERFYALQQGKTNGDFYSQKQIQGAYGTLDEGGGTRSKYYSTDMLKGYHNEGMVISASTLYDEKKSLSWLGMMNKYFACLISPKGAEEHQKDSVIGQLRFYHLEDYYFLEDQKTHAPSAREQTTFEVRQEENLGAEITSRRFTLTTEEHKKHTRQEEYFLFIGPKNKIENAGLVGVLDYGNYFGLFIKMVIWLLNFFYQITHNYGLSIIILTILVKMALFPLTRKQQVIMQNHTEKMNVIKPKMEKIREQYKNDRQRQSEETMKLFRENHVQVFPLMGCLPLLIQMPVFMGIFYALQMYPPLRHAQWLWVNDLAAPDHLFTMPLLPLFGDSFNLLPLLMTITWFFHTKLMPKSEDPQLQMQQKMMQFMPIVIGIMLYHSPSGLILYWFCSTLLGLFEQIYIKKYVKKEKSPSEDDPFSSEKKNKKTLESFISSHLEGGNTSKKEEVPEKAVNPNSKKGKKKGKKK